MLKEYIYENLKEISTELDKINEAYKKMKTNRVY